MPRTENQEKNIIEKIIQKTPRAKYANNSTGRDIAFNKANFFIEGRISSSIYFYFNIRLIKAYYS